MPADPIGRSNVPRLSLTSWPCKRYTVRSAASDRERQAPLLALAALAPAVAVEAQAELVAALALEVVRRAWSPSLTE